MFDQLMGHLSSDASRWDLDGECRVGPTAAVTVVNDDMMMVGLDGDLWWVRCIILLFWIGGFSLLSSIWHVLTCVDRWRMVTTKGYW